MTSIELSNGSQSAADRERFVDSQWHRHIEEEECQFIDQLKAQFPKVYEEIATSIGHQPSKLEEALPVLFDHLKREDGAQRIIALTITPKFASPSIRNLFVLRLSQSCRVELIKSIVECLSHPDPLVGREAVSTLTVFNNAVNELIRDDRVAIARVLLQGLTEYGINNRDAGVAQLAILLQGEIRFHAPSVVMPSLISALGHRDPDVRRDACHALRRQHDVNYIAPAVPELTRLYNSDASTEVRAAAGRALLRLRALEDEATLHRKDATDLSEVLDSLQPRRENLSDRRSALQQPTPEKERVRKPPEHDAAYQPAIHLWRSIFDSYKLFRAFLGEHPEIRSSKPSKNRLLVHAGDFVAAIAKRDKDRTSNSADAENMSPKYLDEIERRKQQIRERK